MRALIVATAIDGLAEVRRDWEAEGVQTRLVTNGEDAYRFLSARLPDLVVLDGSLPETTRLNLHTIVRTRPAAARPPVIFSRAASVPASCAAPDYYLPLEAGPAAISWLGRCVLDLDVAELEPTPAGGSTRESTASAPRQADGRPANGLATVVPASPVLAAHANGAWSARPRTDKASAHPGRERTRAARGRGRGAASSGRAEATRSAPQTSPGHDRAQRNASRGPEMSLLRFLLRWSWILVLMTALGAVGGYGFLLYGPVPYESTATLMLQPQSETSGVPVIASNPQRSAVSTLALAGLAASPTVYSATSRTLTGQLEIGSEELAELVLTGDILIEPVGTSSFITIKAKDPDPNRAWLLADGYSRGFLQDLTAQARIVNEQQQGELRTQINVLQQQLISVPLAPSNGGTATTFSAVHDRILQTLLEAQARLESLSQPTPPVVRYGETSAPVMAVDAKRVVAAGAAAGGTLGLIVAYLGEVLRQWLRRRSRSRPAPSPEASPLPEIVHPVGALAAPGQSRSGQQHEGQPGWASSARA